MSSRSRTSSRFMQGIDEDGVQHNILVTSTGKIITRITGLDANNVQRTILLTTNGEVLADVIDRWNRQLGQIDLALYLGTAPGLTNPIHTQTIFGGSVIDPRDVTDRADRDLGEVDVRFIDESGTAYGIKQIDNKPRVDSTPYPYDIAKGNVPNHSAYYIFGHNPLGAAALETVADISALMPYLAVAERLQVRSNSANDTLLGTGARTFQINGLDGNYDQISETINMNALVNVQTTNYFLRVHQCYVVAVGNLGVNAGTILIRNNADALTLNQVDPDHGASHSANYTVPNGYNLYATNFFATESSGKGSLIYLFIRPLVGATYLSWRAMRVFSLLDSNIVITPSLPFKILEKTDVEIRCEAILAGANVTTGLIGWIETMGGD